MPQPESGLLKIFAAEQEAEQELACALDHPSALTGNDQVTQMNALCHTLSAATGWLFRYVDGPAPTDDPFLEWSTPVNPGVGAALGHLRMDRSAGLDSTPHAPREAINTRSVMDTIGAEPVGVQASACSASSSLKAVLQQGEQSGRRIPAEIAQQLAAQIVELITQRSQMERALCEREAELAAGVPIAVHPRPTAHLAERLEAVLRGGAQSLRCAAAAMYLLDDDTTELKLRAQWGLGAQRLTESGRPLAGALADLEALSGHAVVLEDDVLMELWHVPEPAGAAVCVPISGPTSVLGTMWLYCDAPRRFTATETNLAEILAGRLAADLDREALIVQLQAKRSNALTAAPCRT
ncbi:MAG: GAF domain-containing protein [Planctomycetes bacterium]|nr:GAF domain-containing protein [Planctomycetota bacterium]